jgi:formaldehyde-activating enzyme involved in methanogenesis
MKAVSGRDINVTLINSNSTQIKFSGLDVYSVKDMPISVVYSAQIPQEAYQSALSKAKADAGTRFTIGEAIDLGTVVNVTIRFNSSREDDDVALYQYNAAKNTISLIESKTIGADGVVTFEVRNGGQFVAAITEK